MKKLSATLIVIAIASLAFAGFASNEVYLASVGRGAGSGGAQFYSTVWVTNLSSSATVHFTFYFLKDGQSNLSGAPSFNDTLAPGQTRLYENVTETKLSLPGQFGAARITADGEIFASERVYNLAHAIDNLGTSEGLFFAAVPKNFAIGLGETASVQGVNQGSPTENMRSNFDLVETTGNSCTVHVTLLDSNGTSQGATDVNMVPYGHVKQSAQSLLHSIATINDRIVATVTSGSGKVILAGEQLANTSQDLTGFEMSFKDSLLGGNTGGNCTLCVTSLNGLTGAVTLAAGSNVTLSKVGQTITIAATGGGSGLVLPFSGNNPSPPTTAFSITTSGGVAIEAVSNSTSSPALKGSNTSFADEPGIDGESSGGTGVLGRGFSAGVYGNSLSQSGYNVTSPVGVWGDSNDGNGVIGTSGSSVGVFGHSNSNVAMQGISGNNVGVWGESDGSGDGVYGQSSTGYAVHGKSTNNLGVYGESTHNIGVQGSSTDGTAVYGLSTSYYGVLGRSGSKVGVFGIQHGTSGATAAAGVWGDSDTVDGVVGSTTGGLDGVLGVATLGTGVYGQSSSGTGVYGISTLGYGVFSHGDFGGTGAKYFVEPHPVDASKEIRYVCLEGPEAGTYFRGTARIVNGFATIDVPDHFRMVTAATGITVVAMPMGDPAVLVCVKKNLNQIVIKGSADVEFDYVVNGIRKAFADFQPVAENRDFVPRSPNDDLGAASLPAESVRRLKASGILRDDGSINLETAHRLGWDQQENWKREEAQADRR